MFSCKVRQITAILHSQFAKSCLRAISTQKECVSIIYRQSGDPNKVLEQSSTPFNPSNLGSKEVAIKMLAAPINPSDINMIQGVYPIRPELPAVGGNEGVGEVTAVGSDVADLRIGDWVVPGYSGWGTWRTCAVAPESDFLKVPNDLPPTVAATLGVNSCTAYRMIKDFVELQKGDIIIQNGANSGVGQAVIQIASYFGIQTINIIRNRPNVEELVTSLKNFGATHVVTDAFVRTSEMKDLMRSLPKPLLAFNCVGGKSSAELLKHLGKGGVMVTYGGMSKQPLMVPAGPLIFSDVILRGYWMTEWNKMYHHSPERTHMWDTLADMVRQEKLKLPLCEEVPFAEYRDAVSRSMEPYVSRKQIFVMDL